jgi:CheY-like chemotaxis protein
MAQSKPNILLIDDELQWREYFLHQFDKLFNVTAVSDVPSGLKALDANQSIEVVILDVSIKPNQKVATFTGLDIIYQIRSKRPGIRIIIYTAYALSGSIPASYLDVDVIFTKQQVFEDDVLENAVRGLINVNSTKADESPLTRADVEKLINDQLYKMSEAKEKMLSIPSERDFELIKPLIGFKKDMEVQITKYDYSKNVFLMMKFRDNNKELSDYIIENLEKNGFRGVRADQNEWNITHNVYNPIAVLYCCKYGIALFDEAEDHQAYSPNVAYELAIMHHQNKKCLILKHNTLPGVPFDLIKDLYFGYSKDFEVKRIISNWITQIRHKA